MSTITHWQPLISFEICNILPDYRMKKEIINNIETLLNDLSFYKTTRDLLPTIENLEKFTKTNLIKHFFESLKLQLDELSDDDLKKINSILYAFLEKNKKKFLNKINTPDWAIYEYDSYYLWYITNKKINISDSFNSLFKNKVIDTIYIDNIKRSYTKITENCCLDILHSDKTKIKIKK